MEERRAFLGIALPASSLRPSLEFLLDAISQPFFLITDNGLNILVFLRGWILEF